MNEEILKEEQSVIITFSNGEKPLKTDFKKEKVVPQKLDSDGEVIEEEKTILEDISTISGTDAKGKKVQYVLLSDGRIATVKEGRGSDVEKASMEANGDNTKYLTSMMASTVSIEDKKTNMYDLGKLGMKDYINIQVAFSEINF